jgi:hypothetical protein
MILVKSRLATLLDEFYLYIRNTTITFLFAGSLSVLDLRGCTLLSQRCKGARRHELMSAAKPVLDRCRSMYFV